VIDVQDLNEFPPEMLSNVPLIAISETYTDARTNTTALPELTLINDFYLDCADRDVNASLRLDLGSVGFVSQYDTSRFIDERLWQSTNAGCLTGLFKLMMSEEEEQDDVDQSENNSTVVALAITNKIRPHRRATLGFKTARLDFERLYKMAENFIRIEFVCTDGDHEATSSLLIRVEDLNEFAPTFTHPAVTINRKETEMPEVIYTVEGEDLDGSSRFGNRSLTYSLVNCEPEGFHTITVDSVTGEVRSDLRLDLTPDEILRHKQTLFNESTNHYANLECEIAARDGGNRTGSMHLTVAIENINNSPPQIVTDAEDRNNEIVIEVNEGEQTRDMILKKIAVFDADGASNLRCVFGDGHVREDLFELQTKKDKYDPNLAFCVLKVVDSMYIDYDTSLRSSYLLGMWALDLKINEHGVPICCR
jgi:hypothetical protein